MAGVMVRVASISCGCGAMTVAERRERFALDAPAELIVDPDTLREEGFDCRFCDQQAHFATEPVEAPEWLT